MDHILTYLLDAAAAGTISMSFIQLIKLFPLRRKFQRTRILRWIASQGTEPSSVEGDLLLLTTNGDAAAFYDLEIEQVCAQMSMAGQLVLDYPHNHKALFTTMVAKADPKDINEILNSSVTTQLSSQSANQIQYIAAKNRISHQLQRGIDSIQISVGFEWKKTLQIVSFLLNMIIIFVGLVITNHAQSYQAFLVAILVSILGGILAPVARDLVAGIESWRK